jgi:PAS domain S-box-containing protein
MVGESDTLQKKIKELEAANAALAGELEDLQHAATSLIGAAGEVELYEQILAAALTSLHADFATIQAFCPNRAPNGELRLLRHRALPEQAALRWEWVRWANQTTCAEALRTRSRVAVRDIRQCEFMAGSSDLQGYLELGIIGAQTTPLVSRSGAVLGMVSTYWREPHDMSASEVRAIDLLARLAVDLLERSHANEELRRSEERLRFAQQSAGVGSFDINLETGIFTWTPELEAIHGLPPGAYSGSRKDWEAMIHPDDRARVSALVEAGRQTGNTLEAEWRIVWPDGTVRWVSGRWRVYKNNAGKPVRVMGVNLDVTERKQMEEALRRSEERFRLAVKAANDAVWDIDLKSGAVSWNDTYTTLYGRSEEGAGSWEWWLDHVHPDDRTRLVESFQAVMAGGGSSWSGEYRFRRKDGGWAYVHDRAYIARDASGQAWRVIGSIQDLTERKRSEEAIRESEARFRKMADAAPVLIWVSGPDKLCTFFNKPWLEFRGRTMQQELGNGWAEGVHREDLDRCYSTYSTSFDQRRNFQMEYRLLRADGEYRWVLDTGVSMFTEGGVFEGYIGSCVDISDLKRAQEENLHRQKLETIGVLAAGIAHDFNNLLGGILAQVHLVEDEVPAQSTAAEELLKIKGLSVRASEIVRELMVYAGRETGTLEPVDVSALVEEMIELLRITISKRVVLNTRLAKNLPQCLAQPSQVRQVIMNLVANASEAIGDADGVITVTTALESSSPDSVRIEVSDTGCGMTREQQAKIFDPFYTTKFAGRGLGLAVVQGVVRTHGGTISLDSTMGRGATFRIVLPCVNLPAPRPVRKEPARPQAEHSNPLRTVLLVEDEETLRQAVAKILVQRGFSVIEAGDGFSAINLLRDVSRAIDVVLLDLTIPGGGSGEVVEEVRRSRPAARVVITSAYSQQAGARFSGIPQIAGYLRKPFLANDLAAVLSKVVCN